MATRRQPKTQIHSNSVTAQRQRLYEYLQRCSVQGATTIQFREQLDVMHPAAKVMELRHKYGYNIATIWSYDENAQGKGK